MEEQEVPSNSEATASKETSSSPKPKKRRSKAVIILSILVVLVAAAGAGAYWWRNDQAAKQHSDDVAEISQLKSQLKAKAVADTQEPAATEPSEATKANIIASITSDNNAALEGYMAGSVHVVIAASEGVFDHTPTEAIADLNYISDAVDPWDFALSDATLADYASGDYKAYFKANSIVGVASDGKVVVFNFNDAGKINGIFMSVSADLL